MIRGFGTLRGVDRMAHFEAGAAKTDITPPIGIELAGYGYRVGNTKQATGIHDSLWIRSLALGSSDQCVLILVADLLGIELPATGRIRSLIAERLHVSASDILICCTHTHSAPNILQHHEKDIAVDETWKAAVIDAAVNVAVEAFDNMKPAQIGVGKTEVSGVGANRKVRLDDGSIFHYSGMSARQPPKGRTVVEKGPIDPELGVLCVKDTADRVIAVLINHACHPWLYNGSKVSSEVSGACVELVEDQLSSENPDVVVLFAPGAGSNIITLQNQRPMPEELREQERWFTAERARLGGILAQAALHVVQELTEYSDPGSITSELCPLACPVYDRRLVAVLAEHGGLPPTNLVMDTEVQVVRAGDVVLVGLPSEVYVEYGLEIKQRSRYRDAFVLSYCNDYFADIITHEAVGEGCCPELEWTHVHPDVRHRIMECLEHGVLDRR